MSKVGFGFSKKVKKNEKLGAAVTGIEKERGPELITGIAENAIESTQPTAPEPKKVIAKQENTFQVGVGKRKELYLPDQEDLTADTGDRFEAAPTSLDQSGEQVVYGLNKRARPAEESTADVGENTAAQLLNREKNSEKHKFQEECKDLPDHCDEEGYESMPIEMFGEAMLRGMGWEEGKPLGKNAKGIITPVEYVPRQQLLGLGAAPAAPKETKKRFIKSGESRVQADLVLPTGPDGKVRHLRTLDEKLVEREKPGVHAGKVMVIVAGPHRGMLAKVLSLQKPSSEGRSERATVLLSHSDETIQVRSKELADKDTPTAEEARAELGGKKKKSERRDVPKAAAPSSDRAPKDTGPTWLVTRINVKIVSKTLEGGRFYLKKGEIVDVTGRYSCSVLLEQTGKVVHDIAQRHLETALPKSGGRILVVSGKLKGQRGKLIERNSAREEGSIQLNEDFSFHTLPLDSIAEYVGVEDDLD
uniref:G-patch domain-containing protein n=1 Tax=Pyramimonas obovata TaxID=1411642 RepID=A0A7S0RN92_9CHLO|mmetsp:Transcript_37870/g.82335  ORF Transcript_37870/g.82335 Transcript_37870/m.82335 type:complete len:475 (+) Transcript_37870:200-1624(+)